MNICLSISEINWSITKDIVSILGTLGALVIGYLGLLTWKKQLKGTHYFDLSKRTLILLYKYRAAIKSVRQPFYLPNETSTVNINSHYLSAIVMPTIIAGSKSILSGIFSTRNCWSARQSGMIYQHK
ncbi:hypothetical protein CWN86_09490 [Vibrio splendidus]|nr:hypothetical protein CWN86_09490 [Vibrio splendidus]